MREVLRDGAIHLAGEREIRQMEDDQAREAAWVARGGFYRERRRPDGTLEPTVVDPGWYDMD